MLRYLLFSLFVFFIFNQNRLFTAAFQVYAGAGEVSKTQDQDHCDDIQEFACRDPDACDACAVEQFGGRCRNGNDAGETCLPENNPCDEDDTGGKSPGHCLENTFCAPGRHAMPSVGTPKNFKCLSVKDLKAGEAIIIYRNIDYTGDACIVRSNGVWATPGDQFSKSVDSSPGSGNFSPCRKAGQANAGSGDTCPADTGSDEGACLAPEDPANDAKYPNVLLGTQQPLIDPKNRRRNRRVASVPDHIGENADAAVFTGGDRTQLMRRTSDFRIPDARAVAAGRGIYLLGAGDDVDGQLAYALTFFDNTEAPNDQGTVLNQLGPGVWVGEHMMEIQLMQQFFATGTGAGAWHVIWDDFQNCQPLNDAVTQVLNNCNLIGVCTRVNDLKGLLFRLTNSGLAYTINWSNYLRIEVQALQQYLNMIYGQFQDIARRLGAIMDNVWSDSGVAGPSQLPSQAFAQFVQDRWDFVMGKIQRALDSQRFRNPAELDQLYTTQRNQGP